MIHRQISSYQIFGSPPPDQCGQESSTRLSWKKKRTSVNANRFDQSSGGYKVKWPGYDGIFSTTNHGICVDFRTLRQPQMKFHWNRGKHHFTHIHPYLWSQSCQAISTSGKHLHTKPRRVINSVPKLQNLCVHPLPCRSVKPTYPLVPTSHLVMVAWGSLVILFCACPKMLSEQGASPKKLQSVFNLQRENAQITYQNLRGNSQPILKPNTCS